VTNKTVQGVVTSIGTIYYGHSVIISPGTFLNGLIHIGDVSFGGGRAEDGPSIGLTSCLEQLGLKTMRLKTGTPCRLNSTSINYNELEPQYGDSDPRPFSHFTEKISTDQVPCHIAFTNAKTHAIIKHNIQRSPLYSGKIRGVGPRYCPSIESKIVRFEDKDRHQVFLEPEGKLTNEVYVNGLSTSLPHDVQIKFIRSIKGLERAEIMRFGYAVEYDSVNPTQLKATLETKTVDNLYLAGQINGTSGYEEAACQGLVASINANLKLRGKSPFVLRRDEAYIGVLIDDLVTKGTIEPYRMFTSRAEHRLFLRQDNADSRLMNYGRAFGLLTKDQHDKYLYDEATLERLRSFIKTEKHDGTTIYKYIKRPEILIGDIADMLKSDHVSVRIAEKLAIEVKYEGYIQRELSAIMRSQKLESKKIPQGMEYLTLHGLRLEAREKFQEIQPTSIGQASRISGISPCDISMLMIHMKKMRVYENEVLHQNG
jgi:tRNA uridine 5-carboxymethylaminomethyl modification enzyme